MTMDNTDKLFAGSIPELYDTYLVPLIFEPYAADLARRVAAVRPRRVLEIAAGTGVATRAMSLALPADVSLVATDEDHAYDYVRKDMPHEAVHHGAGEYVRGNVHTNNIESFWSLVKRGVMGTFHKMSKDYLPLYLNEFSFRHNHRHDPDMFGTLVTTCG